MKPHKWTKEQYEYLASIVKGRYSDELAKMMNDKFNIDLKPSQIKAAKARKKLNTGLTGQFKKGQTPWNKGKKGFMGANKTSFKKGDVPKNYMPIGSERVNGYNYIDIKIKDPNKWKGKHIIIWEKHNGEVPKGHAIIFGDGNNRNFDIDNLICVSRQQLLYFNRYGLIKNSADLTKTGIILADISKKISEVQKR